MEAEAQVVRKTGLSMQVCVPDNWTDTEIRYFAEQQNPAGTMHGWQIRKGENVPPGDVERRPCRERPGKVHVVLHV